MGVSGGSLRYQCTYGGNCIGEGGACASKEGYDSWLVNELHDAISKQNAKRIQEVLDFAPQLKERELVFPGESTAMSALALVLNRRDYKATCALLDAGVSPNLPISEDQRSVYAHRSQLAALNGGDPDLQHLVPNTHFEALCSTQHRELFMLLLEKSANPNGGIIQVCHCGDLDMLKAILDRGGEPNKWQRQSTPLVSSVKSKIQPYDKVTVLLRAGADPNFTGPTLKGSPPPYTALIIATRKRDVRMVRVLLDAGADPNQISGDEGLPNALFWATYWGELELVKLFVTLSKHRLDLGIRKYTDETIFDVANTSKDFAALRKPRHIAKLPLPSRPPVVYERIGQMLEDYRAQYPDATGRGAIGGGASSALTGSTTATRREEKVVSSPDRPSEVACSSGIATAVEIVR